MIAAQKDTCAGRWCMAVLETQENESPKCPLVQSYIMNRKSQTDWYNNHK